MKKDIYSAIVYTIDSLVLLPLRMLTKSIAELIHAARMNKDIDHLFQPPEMHEIGLLPYIKKAMQL